MRDIHANMGGSYIINDAGDKVLVHRTGYVAEEVKPEVPAARKAARPAPKLEVVETPTKSTEAGNE